MVGIPERPMPAFGERAMPAFGERGYQQPVHSSRSSVIWHLLLEESVESVGLHAGNRFYGQFTPQQPTHELAANVPDVSGFSRTNPLVQWVGGSVETFSFEARLFSLHRDDQTARNKLEALKLLRIAHPPMNRPPLTRFFWGNAIPGGMQCFVRSLGGITYDEIRSDGSVRGITLNITLVRYTPFKVIRIATSPIEQTPVHIAKDGETYEMIAYRRWGDPMIGVVLRQQTPRFPMELNAPTDIADLRAGDEVKLIDKSELTKQPFAPQSHIFDEHNVIAADNRRYYFNKRNRITSVMPKR